MSLPGIMASDELVVADNLALVDFSCELLAPEDKIFLANTYMTRIPPTTATIPTFAPNAL